MKWNKFSVIFFYYFSCLLRPYIKIRKYAISWLIDSLIHWNFRHDNVSNNGVSSLLCITVYIQAMCYVLLNIPEQSVISHICQRYNCWYFVLLSLVDKMENWYFLHLGSCWVSNSFHGTPVILICHYSFLIIILPSNGIIWFVQQTKINLKTKIASVRFRKFEIFKIIPLSSIFTFFK